MRRSNVSQQNQRSGKEVRRESLHDVSRKVDQAKLEDRLSQDARVLSAIIWLCMGLNQRHGVRIQGQGTAEYGRRTNGRCDLVAGLEARETWDRQSSGCVRTRSIAGALR